MAGQASPRRTRRVVLRGIAGSALASVLAACGSPTLPTPTPLPNAAFRGTEAAGNAGFTAATAVGTPIGATVPVNLLGQLNTIPGVRFALLPGENALQELADNGEILAFLRASLGKPIAAKVSADYATVVNALNAKTVDIAYFSPLAYIYAKPLASLAPLVQGESPDGKIATNRTFLITPASSSIQSPAGLRGKKVAFTAPNSLSGYLVPAYSIVENGGLRVNTDYLPDFRGTAAAVYQAVMSGAVAAGAIPFNDFDYGVSQGQIIPPQLHIIDTSFDYPGSVIAARVSLDPGDRDRIQRAFLALSNQPQQAKVLTQFVLSPPRGTGAFGGNTVKVRVADDSVYDTLRRIPPALGITLQQIVR